MRKLVFYGAISLDGYLADTEDNLQWLFDTPTGETTYAAFDQLTDTLVMGRKTYEEAKKLTEGTPFYQDKEVIVFSRKLKELPDATVVSENPVAYLKQLQQQEGKMIWFVGGGNLLKPLLEADMIDEWWIQIAPVLLGKGKRLFEDGNYHQRLELVDTTQMEQLYELHYRKIHK
ncbi:dihydrofolate reductase family protein [Enterococcus massiliensis]|uniref:dihydrofolate reductase family protein n=1 Tax=Enterococcus massiliensis TaxID=1640685 RepID=UPI00065E8018|nr:dihydrofolate reductase family protein [Enterococcus massiliensis]